MNGLGALKKLPKWLDDEHRDSEEEYFKASEEYKAIEKELKAFEIIKRTALRLVSLEDETTICRKGEYAFYDAELYGSVDLTKEEYKLLEEVLK